MKKKGNPILSVIKTVDVAWVVGSQAQHRKHAGPC